ncbi:MAG: hypothetical protein ACTS85_04685 [Arsenophonus sp. NC-PG7-MAG3]
MNFSAIYYTLFFAFDIKILNFIPSGIPQQPTSILLSLLAFLIGSLVGEKIIIYINKNKLIIKDIKNIYALDTNISKFLAAEQASFRLK